MVAGAPPAIPAAHMPGGALHPFFLLHPVPPAVSHQRTRVASAVPVLWLLLGAPTSSQYNNKASIREPIPACSSTQLMSAGGSGFFLLLAESNPPALPFGTTLAPFATRASPVTYYQLHRPFVHSTERRVTVAPTPPGSFRHTHINGVHPSARLHPQQQLYDQCMALTCRITAASQGAGPVWMSAGRGRPEDDRARDSAILRIRGCFEIQRYAGIRVFSVHVWLSEQLSWVSFTSRGAE